MLSKHVVADLNPKPSTWNNSFFFYGISNLSIATRECQSVYKCTPLTHFITRNHISLLYSSILKCWSAFDVSPRPRSYQFFPQLMLILFLSLPLHWNVTHSIPIIYTPLEPEVYCLPQKFCTCSNSIFLWYCIMGPLLFLGTSYPVLVKFQSMQKAHIFLLLTLDS